MTSDSSTPLFPANLPFRQWTEFRAEGFENPVSGIVYSSENPPCCGVPLGGVGTGCVDVDARGVFGYNNLFNPHSLHHVFPNWHSTRKPPLLQPVFGLNTAGQTWLLASPQVASGEKMQFCTEPQMQMVGDGAKTADPIWLPTPKLEKIQFAGQASYWGHYPIADMEYEHSAASIRCAVRAWAPFIPGDSLASNIPAAVFEVHLRNAEAVSQKATLAFSFPGPDAQEARATEFIRREVTEDLRGMLVSSTGGVEYLLGVLDPGACTVRFGSGLSGSNILSIPLAWSQIDQSLPQPSYREGGDKIYQDGSCSAAVDLELAPGENRIVRFVLAWYAPLVEGAKHGWKGKDAIGDDKILRVAWHGSLYSGDTHYFYHMYAAHFTGALDVARHMAREHAALLARILAWQGQIYTDTSLPVWLRDSLVNNLGLIAEDAYWFQPRDPLSQLTFPLGGFAMNESPRGCPHMSCTPCDWYGNLPVVFFFPELARQTLRLYKEYQRPDGEIPFAIGAIAQLPDMATPEFYWQVSLNGMCYIDMVDRLWQRSGDDNVLAEFYESVKRCNTFTMNLRQGPGGPISMPAVGGMEWFEFGEWAGMATHMGGLRLAELRMVERMAETVGDQAYAEECRAWYAEGSRAMEEDMWAGNYYLNFYEKETGKRSDDVMAYQFDGEWTARYHGLPGVFRADRLTTALDTIRRINVALTPDVGAANFARPDGSALPGANKVAFYGRFTMFTPEVVLLGMTYIYNGEREFGLELPRRHWENLCIRQGHTWDLPNMVDGDSGRRLFGTDYYQDMMLWALPAALEGQDLRASCAPGGLIARILAAGSSS